MGNFAPFGIVAETVSASCLKVETGCGLGSSFFLIVNKGLSLRGHEGRARSVLELVDLLRVDRGLSGGLARVLLVDNRHNLAALGGGQLVGESFNRRSHK